VSEHFKDSKTLGEEFSVIVNVDWKLCALAIGAGGLNWAPFLASEALVFEFNTLGSEHESDRLRTSFYWEVDNFGHILFFLLVCFASAI